MEFLNIARSKDIKQSNNAKHNMIFNGVFSFQMKTKVFSNPNAQIND